MAREAGRLAVQAGEPAPSATRGSGRRPIPVRHPHLRPPSGHPRPPIRPTSPRPTPRQPSAPNGNGPSGRAPSANGGSGPSPRQRRRRTPPTPGNRPTSTPAMRRWRPGTRPGTGWPS
jgi:hypothetical protein